MKKKKKDKEDGEQVEGEQQDVQIEGLSADDGE